MADRIVYEKDGKKWLWWMKSLEWDKGKTEKYFSTNSDGEGIFFIDITKNERQQLTGTCQWSVCGFADSTAKKKIRAFMKDDE